MKFDWLVVGAGLTGAVVAERLASQRGKTVVVIDKRNHIAGITHDCYDQNHILIHQYGPHIFHTASEPVWRYLSNFTEWRLYFHHVLAVVDGKKVPIPFNLNTLETLFPKTQAMRLEDRLIEKFGFNVKVPILQLKETDDKDLKYLADFIYEKIFYGYTKKQWGVDPEVLDPSVTSRVPVLIGRDNRYFHDPYQGVPQKGYTALVARLLDHPNIKLVLNTDFSEIQGMIKFKKVLYTGPIDQYFDYIHGPLPYRSLFFDFQYYSQSQHQKCAQVNYPCNYDFTRITEFKHLTGQKSDGTSIAVEYPHAYEASKNEPYYPVPSEETKKIFLKYEMEKKNEPSVVFAGRLGDYRYYNMDEAVERALNLFRSLGP